MSLCLWNLLTRQLREKPKTHEKGQYLTQHYIKTRPCDGDELFIPCEWWPESPCENVSFTQNFKQPRGCASQKNANLFEKQKADAKCSAQGSDAEGHLMELGRLRAKPMINSPTALKIGKSIFYLVLLAPTGSFKEIKSMSRGRKPGSAEQEVKS